MQCSCRDNGFEGLETTFMTLQAHTLGGAVLAVICKCSNTAGGTIKTFMTISMKHEDDYPWQSANGINHGDAGAVGST